MVSPDRNDTVQDLFQRALDLDRDERTGFLEEACDDHAVRDEVRSLLAAFDEADEFLAEPPQLPGEQEGDQIDRYRLLERIGEGGFGVVWMAEQQEPIRRRVAVKIIKLGMDTRQVVARFEAERQALALMDHPNIAKVLDGGATGSGRPYFVMELVRGMPVTEYCDKANLDTPSRLELFQSICLAVQHAHQKGIIHRDLKPSNILVTMHDGVPVPKVIDFGVAKATTQELTQRTLFTQFRQMIGTPEYMAPEQAEMSGLDVDTRADVYSLGVVLYELLTGTKPFDAQELLQHGYDEMLRHVREVDPPKPSTRVSSLGERLGVVAQSRRTDPARLGRVIRGELDWIAMRALDKQRVRRYPTARALAEDVRRYLDDEPVDAGPPTAGYRAWKFLRRHRGLASAVAVVFVALLAGVVTTSLALDRAVASERDTAAALDQVRAEKTEVALQAERAGVIAGLMQSMLVASDPHAPRRPDMTVRQLLDEFDRDAPALDTDATVAAAIRTTVGTAYRNLGLLDKAEVHLQRALELREQELGGQHSLVADSLRAWAWLQHDRGDHEGARKTALRALQIHGDALGADAATCGGDHALLADCARHLGRYDEALEHVERATALLQGDQKTEDALLSALETRVLIQIERSQLDEAERLQRDLIEGLRLKYGARHLRVANALARLGDIHWRRGRNDDAEAAHREALEQRREFVGERDQRTISSINNLAGISEARGDFETAEKLYRRAIEADQRVGVNPAITRANHALALMRLKRYEEAEAGYAAAIEKLQQLLPSDHPTTAMILQNQARLFELTGRLPQADATMRRVMAMRQRTLPKGHPQLGVGTSILAMIVAARGDAETADEMLAWSERLLRRAYSEPHPYLGVTLKDRAVVLRMLGRDDEAAKLLDEALSVFSKVQDRTIGWCETRVTQAMLQFDQGDLEGAARCADEGFARLPEAHRGSWIGGMAQAIAARCAAGDEPRREHYDRLADAARDFASRRPYSAAYRRGLVEAARDMARRLQLDDEARRWQNELQAMQR
jgi:tetratricopeptide (TPR) repeat protein